MLHVTVLCKKGGRVGDGEEEPWCWRWWQEADKKKNNKKHTESLPCSVANNGVARLCAVTHEECIKRADIRSNSI